MNAPRKTENPWISLIFNIALPTVILMKLSDKLGAELAFGIALSLPLVYGVWDYIQRRTLNFISALGFVSILIKGGLGFFKLDVFWFAVNEAAIPLLLAGACVVSVYIQKPLIGFFMLNDSIVQKDKLISAVESGGHSEGFRSLLNSSTYLLSLSFVVSAVLNFVLAIYLLKSEPGTDTFNSELGQMNLVSMPVILLFSSSIFIYAVFRLFKQVKQMTGLDMQDILRQG
jgi:hypothetical protein